MITIAAPPTMHFLPPAPVETSEVEQNDSETYSKLTVKYTDGTVFIAMFDNGELSLLCNKPLVYDETEKKLRLQRPEDVARGARADS